MNTFDKAVDAIWSERYAAGKSAGARTHWSESRTVIEHITALMTGGKHASLEEAKISMLWALAESRGRRGLPYQRGISVACGVGAKERVLLQRGLVKHFDCYEISRTAIEQGEAQAQECGLEKQMTFHHKDVFAESFTPGSYDLVYWDNALHHMPDAHAAMSLSRELLEEGGCFYMFDYVGPTRFQWTDEQVVILKDILSSIDDSYFLIPGSEYMWKKEPSTMTVEEMLQADPSEAADSANILPAFKKYFPGGTVVPLGGLIYVLALDGIIVNMPEESILLKKMLKLDFILSQQGHNYFAAAHCIKYADKV